MQAVAWIATREPVVVLRASFEEIRHRKATAVLAAHDKLDWCGTEPGISMLAIDLYRSHNGAAKKAARKLVAALARGKVVATASYFTQGGGWGPACQLPQAEWDSIILDTVAGQDRELFPFVRVGEGSLALTRAAEWRVIGIEIGAVLARWPARAGQGGPGTGTKSPTAPCVTLEGALARIKETLGYPDGPAGQVLVNALRQGKFLAWAPRTFRITFAPIDWQESFIVPAHLDEHGQGSVVVGGKSYHPRGVVIAEDEFVFWLNRQSQPKPPEDKPWAKPESSATHSISFEPDASAEPSGGSQAPGAADGVSARRRIHPGLDYRQKDQPLVNEGVEGVITGRFRNSNDAARALADRAEGSATPESKRARLQPQIKRALPRNADG